MKRAAEISMSQSNPWPRRITRRRIILIIVALVGFLAVNGFSFWQFQRAWQIGDRLSADELRQIGAACSEAEKNGLHRLKAEEMPAVFRKLNARSATFYPGSSEFQLYELGEAGVWMRISTSKEDQKIVVSSDFFPLHGNRVLWRKNADYAKQRNPGGRLVTISSSWMRGCRDWIVLPDQIRIIDRNYTAGSDDSVLVIVRLSEPDRQEIAGAIAAIPASVRGRGFTSGAVDGISLHITFAADGRRQHDDIGLANTWRDEVEPLVSAVSALLPPEHAIGFKAALLKDPYYDGKRQSSFTWAEQAKKEIRFIPLPWWSVWPHFLRP